MITKSKTQPTEESKVRSKADNAITGQVIGFLQKTNRERLVRDLGQGFK